MIRVRKYSLRAFDTKKGLAALLVVIFGAVAFGQVQASGGIRIVHLDGVPWYGEYLAQAHGVVRIYRSYPDDHPVWSNYQGTLEYEIQGMPCENLGFSGSDSRRWFALYLAAAGSPIIRLQNFNTSCAGKNFGSFVDLADFFDQTGSSIELLLASDIFVGVFLEDDDGQDTTYDLRMAGFSPAP